MKNVFEKLKSSIDDEKFQRISERELEFLTGGANVSGNAGGSQTSNSGSESFFCCDSTCVCVCIPPQAAYTYNSSFVK